jgi:hypothetical protein
MRRAITLKTRIVFDHEIADDLAGTNQRIGTYFVTV